MSCPVTPEQNGVAERKHRHIVEMKLTMNFHAHVPKYLWVEAFLTVVFLINRLPMKGIGLEIPFYKLYGTRPDYSMLKIFGCLCFPYLRDRASDKFQPYPCVFVGYSHLHKGFRCYHPPTKKIHISRYVVVDENVLPYTNPSSSFNIPHRVTALSQHMKIFSIDSILILMSLHPY